MSQRPRIGGDGRLVLPEAITFDREGFVRGRFSTTTVDPFAWTAERLLLAESFARLELADDAALETWLLANGALDPFDFTGGDAEAPAEWGQGRPAGAFAESRADEAVEQSNLRWHLATLVRLGEHRVDKAWAADWSTFILAGPGKAYLLGGPTSGEELRLDPRLDMRDATEAQAAVRSEVAQRPVVTVRRAGWEGNFGSVTEAGPDLGDIGLAGFRDPTWDWTLALEQRLIDPYIGWALDGRYLPAQRPRAWAAGTIPVPRQEWRWPSALAPIYLQLYEALRRISDGQPGAAICQECGQPFLVLDARRRFFCNDRERYRFAQRERRRRLTGDRQAAEQRRAIALGASDAGSTEPIDSAVATAIAAQEEGEIERIEGQLRRLSAETEPEPPLPGAATKRRRAKPA